MNTLDMASRKVKLRKVSGTKGGEWQGPCPGCGGTDRFHVWPLQNEGKGSYWCRGCEKAGDNIQFLRDFEGMSFRDACAYLNIDMPESPTHHTPAPAQRQKPEFTPEIHSPPAELWQEKAEKLVSWAQANLMKNAETITWLADRGISAETAENFRLGWNPGEEGKDIYRHRKAWGLPEILKDDGRPRALWIPIGLVIPYIVDRVIHRIRIRRPEGDPRYYVIPGSSTATMIIEHTRRAFVIVESELDAITVATRNTLAGAVALGSVSVKPDAGTYDILQGALQVLVSLDYDAAGMKAMKWWREQFDRCDRWPVPRGKDPGEAVKLGIDLEKWIKAGLPPALTIQKNGRTGVSPVSIASPSAIPASSPVIPAPDKDTRGQAAAGIQEDTIQKLSPPLRELYDLLQKNPGVIIFNSPNRFAVLRNGKYVGGRINELIFQVPEVTNYIMNHPATEIDGGNFITLRENDDEKFG
jgi:hypothetical protein